MRDRKKQNNSAAARSFKIDSKRLFEFAKMPVFERLKWLEETNKFLSGIKDKKIRAKWAIFRRLYETPVK